MILLSGLGFQMVTILSMKLRAKKHCVSILSILQLKLAVVVTGSTSTYIPGVALIKGLPMWPYDYRYHDER